MLVTGHPISSSRLTCIYFSMPPTPFGLWGRGVQNVTLISFHGFLAICYVIEEYYTRLEEDVTRSNLELPIRSSQVKWSIAAGSNRCSKSSRRCLHRTNGISSTPHAYLTTRTYRPLTVSWWHLHLCRFSTSIPMKKLGLGRTCNCQEPWRSCPSSLLQGCSSSG